MSDKPSKSTFEELLLDVVQTVRASSSLAAQDVNFYKSLDSELSSKIDESAKSLLDISNKLIHCSFDDVKDIPFGKDNISSHINWNPIANVLDNIFEKIDVTFDQAQNANSRKLNNDARGFTYLEDNNDVNDNYTKHQGKRMVKPQVNFRNKVDNSETHPFKPRITTKHNELKLFEESTKLIVPAKNEEDFDPEYYAHPYEFEIDHQPYPDSILTIKEPVPSKPWHDTSAIWIETVDSLNEMICLLSKQSEIAIDLEHHDYRSYYGIVCLMQISSRDQDWIIDTLKLRDDLEGLNKVFTDPNIVKVFHGAFMDIIWLQRDLGLYVVSLFDTYHASKKLGFPKFSLAYLLETFANFKTSKKYQLADWRVRPLSPPMLAYARSDTHFLLNIYDQLRNKLIVTGKDRLQEVLYESRQVAKRRFEYTRFRPISTLGGKVSCPIMANNPKEPFSSILLQYNVPFHKKPLIEALYNWRDSLAKRDDESVRYIMSNQLLVSLSSLNQPVDVQKVLGVSNYVSDYVRQNAKDLANLIENTLNNMAESDWDLVDKWSDVSKASDNDNLNISDNDIDKIISNSKVFEGIYARHKSLLFYDSNILLNNKSTLFSKIFNKDYDQFSVEYDIEKNKAIKHTSEDYKFRLDYASKSLQLVPLIISPELSYQNELHEEAERPQMQNVLPKNDSFISNNKEIDPNEVITLRKTQKQKAPKSEIKPKSKDKAFDYNNANKILLDSSVRNNSRKDKLKKRSFDPYNKEADGPKGAKKVRRSNVGKTSTFSVKK